MKTFISSCLHSFKLGIPTYPNDPLLLVCSFSSPIPTLSLFPSCRLSRLWCVCLVCVCLVSSVSRLSRVVRILRSSVSYVSCVRLCCSSPVSVASVRFVCLVCVVCHLLFISFNILSNSSVSIVYLPIHSNALKSISLKA